MAFRESGFKKCLIWQAIAFQQTEKEEQKTLSKDKKDTGQDADLGPRG